MISAFLSRLDLSPLLWLVIVPAGAVPWVYLLRRWGIGALLAAGVSLAMARLAWGLPPQELLTLAGRPVSLDLLTGFLLALVFSTAAVLFLLAWRLPQGRSFVPFGMLTLALWSAAALVKHLGLVGLILELAAITLVFVIQAGLVRLVRASWRLLVMFTLALPLFLLAAWRIELYEADVSNAVFLNEARIFLAVGFAFWLAVVPLHGWLTAVADDSLPLVVAFVLIGFPTIALSALLHSLIDSPWLTSPPIVRQVLVVAGLITIGLGGVYSALQRSFGGLLGRSALFDLGCGVLALAVGGGSGGLILLAGFVARGLALTLAAAAGAALRFEAGGDAFSLATGLGRKMPLTVAGLTLGGLALAGAPLTVGFAPRWLLFEAVVHLDPRLALWVSLAGLGVAIGYLRGLAVLLTPNPGRPGQAPPREQVLTTAVIVGLSLLCLILGLFPQWYIEPVRDLVGSLSLPAF
jgi:NADH:ubiquinone oxidoreductase subunit 2 (subunit N)